MQFWNELEGQVIEGYPLRRLVRSEGRTAWFDSVGSNNEAVTISLTESLTDADEVTERLEAAQQLKHPNLIAIGKVGRTRIGETLVVYAVMEHADQDLSEVLRSQPLAKEEARQVAEAMVEGLMAIHKRGMVHGRIEAASVLAVGEAVKLRSDCLQSPGGTRAGDVAGMGTILFQAFTQRKAPAADDAQINRIPAPFAEIVRNSLSARWGLAQIASALKPAAASNPPAVPPSSPSVFSPAAGAAPPSVKVTTPQTTPRITPQTTPKTAPAEGSMAQPASPLIAPAAGSAARTSLIDDEDETGEDSGRKHPLGLYATVGMALLVLLAWFLFRPKAKPPVPPSPARISQSAPEASGPTTLPPAMSGAPAETASRTPAPSRRVKPSPATQTAAPGAPVRSVWRVVAYTYAHLDQAQHKVDEINQAHPQLAASVYSANHNRGPFLVTLGGAMDRSQALKLRTQAIGLGMAQDSYAQNFAH